MKNEFFDPDQCPFEVLGFYEELIDRKSNRVLGVRTIEAPTRKLGSDGWLEYDLTEDTLLRAGHKERLVKASKEEPVRVAGMLQVLCGRSKALIPKKPLPDVVEVALREWEESHRVWMDTPVHQNYGVTQAMNEARARYERLFDAYQESQKK